MKTWYLSKTLWVNAVAVAALMLQTRFGFVIDPEAQTGVLALINIILRCATNAPLDWASPSAGTDNGGFIRLPLLFALVAIIGLAGCALTKSATPSTPVANDSPQVLAGKSLLAVKSTIVVSATSVDSLCRAGTLKPDVCAQAKATYEQTKPAYDAAVDAYLLMMSVGGDSADFGRALARVQSLANNLIAVAGGAK